MVAYNVVRIQGTLPSGEVWSINPKFVATSGTLVIHNDPLQSWADNIAAMKSGKVAGTQLLGIMGKKTAITSIRCEHRNTDDVLVDAAEATLSTPAYGTIDAKMPHQVAWVVSLRTNRAGRSYRGRLYWPALAAPVLPDTSRIWVDNLDVWLTDMSDLLGGIQSAAPSETPVTLAVVSQTRNTATAVTRLEGGDVLDTQRRRRDALDELYRSKPFAPAGVVSGP